MVIKPKDVYMKEIEKSFERFNNKYIKFADEIIYNSRTNREINRRYDFFITGSDQVWNPHYTVTSSNDFIAFAEHRKKLSYAASMGVSKLPSSCTKQYKKWINDMYSLSVRETDAADLIYELCGRKADVHIDPTLLLTKKHWKAIEKKPSWHRGEKYVLAYFLGYQYETIKMKLHKAEVKYNSHVIHVFSREQGLEFIHDPSEFLWLIHNAEEIYTDSFHCVVFSLIFSKPFMVFRRAGDETKTGSRIDTLLSKFDMSMKDKEFAEIFEYNDEQIQNVLDEERKKSKKYLKSILEL